MSYKEWPLTKEIYRPYGRGFGDCWSVLNYFIHVAKDRKKRIRLSLWYRKNGGIKRADKFKEMLPLLEDDELIQLGEWEATEPKPHWTMGHKYPFTPTKIKWHGNSSCKICYQFDAKSKSAARFPSKEIEEGILDSIQKIGYETIKIGGGMTLEECTIALSQCELFLGVDSGMAYLAASVGVPIIFTRNQRSHSMWDTVHSTKHFVLADDHVELVDFVREYTESGIKYYINKARNVELFRKESWQIP